MHLFNVYLSVECDFQLLTSVIIGFSVHFILQAEHHVPLNSGPLCCQCSTQLVPHFSKLSNEN